MCNPNDDSGPGRGDSRRLAERAVREIDKGKDKRPQDGGGPFSPRGKPWNQTPW